MDRIIKKVQAAAVGGSDQAILAAKAIAATGAQAGLIAPGKVACAAQLEAMGITVVEDTELKKIIFYPEGRVAGVMCSRTTDGRKVIVNGDAFALDAKSTEDYMELIKGFGAAFESEKPVTREAGLVVCQKDACVSGIYLMGDAQACGKAAGDYGLDVDERIYSRFRKNPMVQTEPTVEGEYLLTIIGMPDVPKHKITIKSQDGKFYGTHATENDEQPMQDVRMENDYLCWNLWSGTTSSELFTFQLKPYGNVWLGGTWRIDTENAHHTPVMMESPNRGPGFMPGK